MSANFENLDLADASTQKFITAIADAVVTRLEPKYLDIKTVVKRLGVSDTTLYNWINEGLITPIRVGGRTLFLESDLNESLNQCKGKYSLTRKK